MSLPHLIWDSFMPLARLLWKYTSAEAVRVAKGKEKNIKNGEFICRNSPTVAVLWQQNQC